MLEYAMDIYPVRVWMGYCLEKFKTEETARQKFYHCLGAVFIPATVQIMAPLGLTAYLPTVIPPDDSRSVPDEIALVFYESRAVYRDACKDSVGGRAYAMLHESVFNFTDNGKIPKSHSGFPCKFSGAIEPGTAYYYLFDESPDWQLGQTAVLVGVNSGGDLESFTADIARIMQELQQAPPKGMDGAVFTVQSECVVFWSHWTTDAQVRQDLFDSLTSFRIIINQLAKKVRIPQAITADFGGIKVAGGDSFNFRFVRRTVVASELQPQADKMQGGKPCIRS